MMVMMISSHIGDQQISQPIDFHLVYQEDVKHLVLQFWDIMSSIKVLAHIPRFIDILAPACLAIRPYVWSENKNKAVIGLDYQIVSPRIPVHSHMK